MEHPALIALAVPLDAQVGDRVISPPGIPASGAIVCMCELRRHAAIMKAWEARPRGAKCAMGKTGASRPPVPRLHPTGLATPQLSTTHCTHRTHCRRQPSGQPCGAGSWERSPALELVSRRCSPLLARLRDAVSTTRRGLCQGAWRDGDGDYCHFSHSAVVANVVVDTV